MGRWRSLILGIIIESIIMIGILQVLISFVAVFSCLLASAIFLFCCKGILSLHFVLFHIDNLCIPKSKHEPALSAHVACSATASVAGNSRTRGSSAQAQLRRLLMECSCMTSADEVFDMCALVKAGGSTISEGQAFIRQTGSAAYNADRQVRVSRALSCAHCPTEMRKRADRTVKVRSSTESR